MFRQNVAVQRANVKTISSFAFFRPMNVYTIFENAARCWPQHTAIVDGEARVTFAQLLAEVEAQAADLHRRGLRAGHRVLVFVPMSIDLYRIVLAIFKIGATAVFLDEWVSWRRMDLCAQLADCQGFVAPWWVRVLAFFSGPLRRIPVVFSPVASASRGIFSFKKKATPSAAPTASGFSFFKKKATPSVATAPGGDAAALITFTTGSTGTPKAALRSHAFLREQFEALREEINPQPGDVDMTVLPIVLLINLGAGATSVIARFKAARPDALRPDHIFEQIKKHRVVRITASPYFVRRLAEYLLAHPAGQSAADSVRQIFTGGAPVFPAEAQLLVRAWPHTDLRIAYGSTEAEPISLISTHEVAALDTQRLMAGLPVGQVYHKAQVRIIDIRDEPIQLLDNESLVGLPDGQVGEIVVAGLHVLRTYFNNPEAWQRNKIKQSDGTLWHRTGDSGWLEADGCLHLMGRCATLFEWRGRMICPFLYEAWLQARAGVVLATVLHHDERIFFVLECTPDADQTALRAAIGTLDFEGYEVIFLKKMPRDPRHHSKIEYGKLRALLDDMG
jgi:olefin beta-lactone synthetase